ncbi:MAG: hypothetical protein IKD58_17420 [Loktanella sp.]|nr:hypothetical protein [Loktanella sp.]
MYEDERKPDSSTQPREVRQGLEQFAQKSEYPPRMPQNSRIIGKGIPCAGGVMYLLEDLEVIAERLLNIRIHDDGGKQ